MMKRVHISIAMAAMLSACASWSPPAPPLPDGEYRPINIANPAGRKGAFDFSYEGDIADALPALKKAVPALNVQPTLGKAFPLSVRVDLHGTTLETALRTLAEQGGGAVDVVWNTTPAHTINEVYIRYRADK